MVDEFENIMTDPEVSQAVEAVESASQEPTKPRCRSCRFWEPSQTSDAGECRRHAPKPFPNAAVPMLFALADIAVRAARMHFGDDNLGHLPKEFLSEDATLQAYAGRPGLVWPETFPDQWCGEWEPLPI